MRYHWPNETVQAVLSAYRGLCPRSGKQDQGAAVRSSASAEDLPDASFADQQEVYLNIRGEAALLDAPPVPRVAQKMIYATSSAHP